MKTQDLENMTNTMVQKVLAEFRKNEVPAPWGKDYLELRDVVKLMIVGPALESHLPIEKELLKYAMH